MHPDPLDKLRTIQVEPKSEKSAVNFKESAIRDKIKNVHGVQTVKRRVFSHKSEDQPGLMTSKNPKMYDFFKRIDCSNYLSTQKRGVQLNDRIIGGELAQLQKVKPIQPSLYKRLKEQEYLDHTSEQSTRQLSTEEEIRSQECKVQSESAKVQSESAKCNWPDEF